MDIYLRTLFELDMDYLRENPFTESPYGYNVRYKAERSPAAFSSGTYLPESWKTIPEVIRDGHGDCEDLSCWLAAYFSFSGIAASPFWTKKIFNSNGTTFTLYHIRVRMNSGEILDPSRDLGMKG
jgi:hypothetical protein